jgi:hypothetical protein
VGRNYTYSKYSTQVSENLALDIENFYLDKDPENLLISLESDFIYIKFEFESQKEFCDWFLALSKWCVKLNLSRDYKLLDKIGKGGFGAVYKATNLFNGDIVAMKVIEKDKIKTIKNYVSFYPTHLP